MTTTAELQEKIAAFAWRIVEEMADTKEGDTHKWRIARLSELQELTKLLEKFDKLDASVTETDAGPFEYMSVGET